MKRPTVPHDEYAETAVLGGVSIWSVNAEQVFNTLTSADFYSPRNQRWFLALHTLYSRGDTINVTGLAAELHRMGEEDGSWLAPALGNVAERDIRNAMRVVLEHSLRRRIIAEAGALNTSALDLTVDPGEALDMSRASLASIDTPLSGAEPDDQSVDEFLAQEEEEPTPWLIPGLLGEGWRTVVVAREGQGKTWLLRQIAVCAAYGIHPLSRASDHERIVPVRTLLIDLENPRDHLRFSLDKLTSKAKGISDVDAESRMWCRPGGIDLRKRADRAEVENILRRRRPELVVMGPLYKSYRVKGSEAWDLVASEVQAVLDDWRARFGITLLIEDHAPKGQLLVPFGSSLWLRWPEVGLALEESNEISLKVGRWRGDRMTTDWPYYLDRGRDYEWPWQGAWGSR